MCRYVISYGIYILIGDVSPATSGRLQIALMCRFCVMFGSQFHDNCSIDFETVDSIGNGDNLCALLALLQVIRVFASFASSEPIVDRLRI